jgi:hypothetical protein
MAEDAVTDTGTNVVDGANEGATEATVNVDNNGGTTDTNTEQSVEQQGVADTDATQMVSALDYSALKVPEGMSVSDEDRARFQETVDKFGFKNQEGLQNFVDWMFKTAEEGQAQMQKHSEEQAAASQKEWEEIKSGWKVSLEKDADFGKDYDMNMKRANDAMSRFGGSELTNWLKEADLIEHPALIKAFARIGKEVEDAKLLKGEKSAETTKRPVDRYNQPMFVYND